MATSPALNEQLDKLKLLCNLSQQKSTKLQIESVCCFSFTPWKKNLPCSPRGVYFGLPLRTCRKKCYPTTRGSSSFHINHAPPRKKPGELHPSISLPWKGTLTTSPAAPLLFLSAQDFCVLSSLLAFSMHLLFAQHSL